MAINKICNIAECTGCEACAQTCSHSAITMLPDGEGFLRPHINRGLCVDCGLCQLRCPVNTPLIDKMEQPKVVYSGWSNSERTRIESSSGGAFTEIARLVLAEGGVVFGVVMDGNAEARHVLVDSEDRLSKLQGSKYVQSIMGDAYKQAKDFLDQGRPVLFSGTPCQIGGLRNFLHKDYENLMTVDIICHGVPSPRVFADYKSYVEGVIKEKVRDVKFRCKKSSWIFFNMGINPHVEKNGDVTYSYIGNYYADPYIRAFLRDNILRPNCYHCHYTSVERCSDFTIADWWGYKAVSPEDKDFDRKGVSLIMCNTEKAVRMVDNLDMWLRKRTVEDAIRTNLSLRRPFPIPTTREAFWDDYNRLPFTEMIRKWMYPDRIPMSAYLRIYHRRWRLLFRLAHLYERVANKAHFGKLVIRIKAK